MKKTLSWIPIFGSPKILKDKIEYSPILIKDGPSKGQNEICFVKSNVWFQAGTICFDAIIKEQNSRMQLVLNHGESEEVFIGIGAGGAYGIQKYSNNSFETLTAVGGVKPTSGKCSIEVQVIGSRIRLFINGVHVSSAIANINKCQPALFMAGEKEIFVENISITTQTSNAFVVMQFTPEFNDLFAEVIKPTVESFGIDCIRADDIYNSGSILDDITQSLIEASFIVADITPDNPNVFYEVGYAHAIKKPVILLSDSRRDRLPFDVSGFRVIIYENSIGGKTKVEERLRKHIINILNG